MSVTGGGKLDLKLLFTFIPWVHLRACTFSPFLEWNWTQLLLFFFNICICTSTWAKKEKCVLLPTLISLYNTDTNTGLFIFLLSILSLCVAPPLGHMSQLCKCIDCCDSCDKTPQWSRVEYEFRNAASPYTHCFIIRVFTSASLASYSADRRVQTSSALARQALSTLTFQCFWIRECQPNHTFLFSCKL